MSAEAARKAAETVEDMRFRQRVRQLLRLGERAVGELLAELGAERGIRTAIDEKLQRYGEISPKTISAVGGDQFSPLPLHPVPKDREREG